VVPVALSILIFENAAHDNDESNEFVLIWSDSLPKLTKKKDNCHKTLFCLTDVKFFDTRNLGLGPLF
jgi:hypothetical protein